MQATNAGGAKHRPPQLPGGEPQRGAKCEILFVVQK
jgi:hypothetical protein